MDMIWICIGDDEEVFSCFTNEADALALAGRDGFEGSRVESRDDYDGSGSYAGLVVDLWDMSK
jgi:hypothetical protein